MSSDIRQLTPEQYPELLKEINDPPKKLYVKGELPPDDMKYLCVVGSRKYTPYGKEVCKTLIEGLSGYPIVIVSGLAIGIDSIAHESALEAGLKTIAVPGSGLSENVLHPKTNKLLAKRIIESGGTMLSEFEEGFKATHYSFPQRNRVMAGMSHAVLIIEAEEKSGTLITARLALSYNRDIGAVPGAIDSRTSKGTHALIKDGAALIETPEDILELLDLTPSPKKDSTTFENLSSFEKEIVDLLSNPKTQDELLHDLSVQPHELSIQLSALEIKGVIETRLGKIQTRTS